MILSLLWALTLTLVLATLDLLDDWLTVQDFSHIIESIPLDVVFSKSVHITTGGVGVVIQDEDTLGDDEVRRSLILSDNQTNRHLVMPVGVVFCGQFLLG